MFINRVPSYYSEDQLRAYLLKIGYPAFTSSSELPPPTLPTLRILMLQHLLTFAYEYTTMHYTADHLVRVAPPDVFNRMVRDGKGGSYCFGQNTLFLGMLRALGYPAYGAGARINAMRDAGGDPVYGPIRHGILFVKPDDGAIQLVDVGYGGNGLLGPMKLREREIVTGGACGESHRLTLVVPSWRTRGDAPSWTLECLAPEWNDWRVLYSFDEVELSLPDWDALSFAACARSTEAMFWHDIVCVRYIRTGDQEVGRMVMRANEVRRRVRSDAEVVKVCKTEQDRQEMLKEHFGVTVTDDDIQWVKGREVELPVR